MKIQYDGSTRSAAIPASGTWTQVTIDNIAVMGNRADISFTSNASAGQWLQVDDVILEDIVPLSSDVVIDNGDPGYAESGVWNTSSLPGFNNTGTRYAGSSIGPSVKWTPSLPSSGNYDVYVYKIVNANSDPNAKIEVVHNGGTDTQYVNYTSGSSGWVHLGTYSFSSGTSGYVKNSLNTAGTYARADAVKFVPVEVIVDNGAAGYSETGTWHDSSLTGYNGSGTRYSDNTGSHSAKWTPNLPIQGNYRVYIYKIVNTSSDPNAKVDIVHQGGTQTVYVNYTTGTSGWVDMGVYAFNSGNGGYISNSLNTQNKNARADAVKLVRVN